jgi:hypothetical protein
MRFAHASPTDDQPGGRDCSRLEHCAQLRGLTKRGTPKASAWCMTSESNGTRTKKPREKPTIHNANKVL